jgi:hypothetical protein
MSFQKKLVIVLVVLTVAGILVAWNVAAHSSRAAVAVLAAGCFGYFVVTAVAHARYSGVMKRAAADLGLAFVGSSAAEKASPVLSHVRKTTDSDVFRWKVDGKFPVLVGDYQGFPVNVRVPFGVDFDAAAPDSTRIVVYHSIKMTGFTVYDRTRLKKEPKGRQSPVGDATFDSRFLVLALRPEEPKTVLSPAVRELLLEAGGIGFRGIEVNRYGVFLYEEGKVSNSDLLTRRLNLLVSIARAAQELARAET